MLQQELKRYSRQIILPEIGLTGQQKLKRARILMIGAGGLGCPVLQYLAAAGIGTIGIVDDDVVDQSNLHRQILFNHTDVGNRKASVAKDKLNLINPFIHINSYTTRLTSDNIDDIFSDYDLIIDGSDNFTTRYLVNDSCVKTGKPLIFGSIYKFEGQVSVFNHQGGPNYRNLYSEAPMDGEVPNCSDIGVIGVLPGLVGLYMANEAIKLVCEIGDTLSGKLMCVDALTCNVTLYAVPSIPVPQKLTEAVREEGSIQEVSIETLITWLKDKTDEVCLIDVREDYEFEENNIGGINISLYELAGQKEVMSAYKKIIFCCATGHRSKQAVNFLKPLLPYVQLFSLQNGIA